MFNFLNLKNFRYWEDFKLLKYDFEQTELYVNMLLTEQIRNTTIIRSSESLSSSSMSLAQSSIDINNQQSTSANDPSLIVSYTEFYFYLSFI